MCAYNYVDTAGEGAVMAVSLGGDVSFWAGGSLIGMGQFEVGEQVLRVRAPSPSTALRVGRAPLKITTFN